MITEADVICKINDFLYDGNKIDKEDFKKLFGKLNREDILEIIKILKSNNIEIVIDPKNDRKISNTNKVDKNINYKELRNLSNEQLCALYNQGNKEIITTIVEKNTKLIWSRVRKYNKIFNHKLEDEDLFQSGAMGLIKAVENFKNDKGANLTTYSVWWIDQKIRRDIADLGYTIRIPVHIFETVVKVNSIVSKNQLVSKDELIEIAKSEGISEENFKKALFLKDIILKPVSINTSVGEDDDSELMDFIEDKEIKLVDDEVIEKMLKKDIEYVLKTLNVREKEIIELRFGLLDGRERTLEEVGRIFGVTRERIRQIEAKALRKLRHPSRCKKIKNYLIEE